MRVTQQMLANSVSQNLRNNLNSLEKKSNQLSMGKQFDRPSQDPTGTYKVMGLTKIDLARNEQSQRNINEGISWMTATEDVLEKSKEAVHRLRELAIYTASDSMTDEDREKAASEVKEIRDHLVGLANTEMRGLYLFGGHKTEDKPFNIENVDLDAWQEAEDENIYSGDEGERMVEIAPGQEVQMNLTGKESFKDDSGEWLFETVDKMHNRLLNKGYSEEKGTVDSINENGKEIEVDEGEFEDIEQGDIISIKGQKREVKEVNENSIEVTETFDFDENEDVEGAEIYKVIDSEEDIDQIIGELDSHLDNLLQKRSELGARMERFYSTEDRLHDENINLKEMRSNVEDLDMAEAITEYSMLENSFQAALATGARMVQPSLVDFLN